MKKPVYDKGTPLKLEELSPEQLQYLQQSDLAKVSTDPRFKDAQLAALQALEERSKTGLTAQDEADMYKLQRNVSTQNRGRMGAIQNNMAVRGMSGSGMDALMQLQANQDATDREALAAMEKAGQSQNMKLSATQQLGQMGTQMRNQDFGEQAQKAQAQDAINRFNTSTRNTALGNNNQVRNQANTQNWNRGNQVNDQNVTMGYNYDAEMANRKQQADDEKRRRKSALGGAILGAGGAIAGGFMSAGNPMGVAAGYQAGNAIGQNIQGYAYGGIVKPNVDDPANDVIPALLSEGEAVIPRSAMSSEQMFEDYTSRLKEAVKARQGKIADAESNVKNAQYGSIFANALNDFSKGNRKDTVLYNNISNLGGKPNVIQGEYNTIKDTWTDPAKDELARQDKGLMQDKADFGQSENMQNYLDDKVRKRSEQGQNDWRFGQEQDKASKAQDLFTRESDPSSQESKLAQTLAKKMAPGFDFSTMSASQINERLPNLTSLYKMEQDKLARQDTLAAKADAKKAEAALKGTEGQRAVDKDFAKDYNEWSAGGAKTARSEIEKLKGVADKLRQDKISLGRENALIPDLLADYDRLGARADVQSTVMNSLRAILGAQFTEGEGKRIIANTWNENESEENNLARVDRLIKDLENQANDKDTKARLYERTGSIRGLDSMGSNTGLNNTINNLQVPTQTQQSAPKAKTVIQNGKTFILNEETGRYERQK